MDVTRSKGCFRVTNFNSRKNISKNMRIKNPMRVIFLLTILVILNAGCLSETLPPSVVEEGHFEVPAEFRDMINPVPSTQGSISRGSRLYDRYCASCHGPQGLGDGQMAMMLERKPSNLHDAQVQKNTDGSLFYFITEGIVEAKMPGFPKLSEEDRWNLVNYMRTFEVE